VFKIEMLPAERGDALWLTYGEPPDLHHVLIDGGPKETIQTLVPTLEDRIDRLGNKVNRLELLTITHIDTDHIQGVASLLSDHSRVKLFRDVWFNGYRHLGLLGGPDGERLTSALAPNRGRWNRAFGGGAVVISPAGKLPTKKLRGGLELTLLSPTPDDLARLAPKWERECKKAGIVPGTGAQLPRSWRRDRLLGLNLELLAAKRYKRDRAEANGSSIAFIATYDGASVLCAADAHSEVLEQSLGRLGPGPHTFTAVKVSHHGSRANLSPRFLERVCSRNWLLSTNGARFSHPSPETIARIATTQRKPVFHLNYVTPYVKDVIDGAGDAYSVKLPRKRAGAYQEGVVVRLA
jgi:beta-lactamase superfamily II metal-dependent hydrolase